MNIVTDLNLFKTVFKDKFDQESIEYLTIYYQKNNNHILSKEYIELIENTVQNTELWKSYFTELSDQGRIVKVESTQVDADELCIEIFENYKQDTCVFVSLNNEKINSLNVRNIPLENESYKVIKSLLTKSNHILYVHDFENNKEIESFFNLILTFQSNVNNIYIFNREFDLKFLNSLKSKRIHYYTLLKRDYKIFDLKQDLKDNNTFKVLGRGLTCYYTFNRTLIHERKIVLGNLIISPDNAFINLNIEEPTWQITIDNNKVMAQKWKEKCSLFKRTF